MSQNKPLQFHADGSFKIVQLTDIQDGIPVSQATVDLIEAVMEQEKPDLVVFTGDQIKGYDPTMRGKNRVRNVKRVLEKVLEPLRKRGIPFTFTFGNHDKQCPVSREKQLEIYQEFENCLAYDTPGVDGCANHNLPILSSDGTKDAFNIYCVDSHGNCSGDLGGYDPVTPNQIDWYRKVRDELKEKNGDYVPSLLFQHIPVDEMYELFTQVPKGTKGAVPAFRKRKGQYYVVNKELTGEDAYSGETPASPDINNGQFEAACEKGDMLGMYFGHDHKNCMEGKVKGVRLGYTPGCGFHVYGPGRLRGARVFEINENDPANYVSRMVTYADLFGEKVKVPFSMHVVDATPTSVEAAKPMIATALGVIIAIVGAIIAFKYFL